MTFQARLSQDGIEVTLDMPERFDFGVHTDFRKSYEENRSAKKYIINLKKTRYMDSSALGMLLQLHEHLGGDNSSIRVKNADHNITEILTIANFEKMMQIC